MAGPWKLIGEDIVPPDLVAKITGKAKYAEDFRAEGMLFAKILASPMPHARVTRIDASAALRMPGVEGVITAEDLPPTDNPYAERALTMEPLYEGEAILAVAAVDETTAAEAIERIEIDFEPLPFVVDPLDSLRPDGPDARVGGNSFVREEGETNLHSIKWPAETFDNADDGLAMGEVNAEWEVGDIEEGFAEADFVLDETIVHQSLTHHPLEPRSCMAYWQNGKLYLHASTQSTQRTAGSVARGVGIDEDDVVFVAEYCGGGFGSKIAGTVNMPIPALLSRKTGKPVMYRVTRAEENFIGRARCGFQARVKMGWRADGRLTALDLFIVQDNGPYGRQGDMFTAGTVGSLAYTPLTMRFRGVTVLTNTPPRSAQRGPGGVQVVAMLEPLMDRAARQLSVDRVEMRRINAADKDTRFGSGQAALTSAFVREAIDLGAELFDWESKSQLSGQRDGTKVTGVGVAVSPFIGGSVGYDGLIVLKEDGKLRVHQGIGNLGTHSVADTARAAAEVLDLPWEQVEIVWGSSARHLPYSAVQAGSQTAHAHTRANYAAGLDAKLKLQEIAARDLGGSASDYDVGGGRVTSRSNRSRSISFAAAARRAVAIGGRYDGHETPEDINAATAAAAAGLAGQGLMGVAKDDFGREGSTFSWVIGFARVEIDVETGQMEIVEYVGTTDCGTILHPRSLGAQIYGGSIQGFGVAVSQKWVYDPQWGVPFTKGFHMAKPPTMLDIPLDVQWGAVNEPDPQTPVGVKGIGEPPVGAGAGAVACAIQDALGAATFNRTPITTEMIMAELEDIPAAPFRRPTAHL